MNFKNNKTYDVLVYIAQIGIPALCVFLTTIIEIWHLPYGIEIVGTLAAIDTLLGALLKISSVKYNKKNKEISEQFKEEDK